jgi:hypothetical protein
MNNIFIMLLIFFHCGVDFLIIRLIMIFIASKVGHHCRVLSTIRLFFLGLNRKNKNQRLEINPFLNDCRVINL